MPDDRIAALDHWRASEHVRFDDRERAALGFVDAICKGRDGIRAAREVLNPLASEGAIVAIALLAGWVRTQGDLAAAFALKPGEAFVGWELYAGEGVTTL